MIFSHYKYFDDCIDEALPREEDWFTHQVSLFGFLFFLLFGFCFSACIQHKIKSTAVRDFGMRKEDLTTVE